MAVHVPSTGVGVRNGEGHVAGDGGWNEGRLERGECGGGGKGFRDSGIRGRAG